MPLQVCCFLSSPCLSPHFDDGLQFAVIGLAAAKVWMGNKIPRIPTFWWMETLHYLRYRPLAEVTIGRQMPPRQGSTEQDVGVHNKVGGAAFCRGSCEVLLGYH